MIKKYTLTLDNEFIMYCELNKITDIETFAKETFNKGFTILKYGDTPEFMKKLNPTPKPTSKPKQKVKVKPEPTPLPKPVVTKTIDRNNLYDE